MLFMQAADVAELSWTLREDMRTWDYDPGDTVSLNGLDVTTYRINPALKVHWRCKYTTQWTKTVD